MSNRVEVLNIHKETELTPLEQRLTDNPDTYSPDFSDTANSHKADDNHADPGLLGRLRKYVAHTLSAAALAAACILPNAGCAGCGEANAEPSIPEAPSPIEDMSFDIAEAEEPICGRYFGSIAFTRGRPTSGDLSRYVGNLAEHMNEMSQLRARDTEITEDMTRANMLRMASWLNRIVVEPEAYMTFMRNLVSHAEEIRANGPVRIDIYGIEASRSRRSVATNRALIVQRTLELYLEQNNAGLPIDQQIDTDHVHSFPVTNAGIFGMSSSDNSRTLVLIRNLTESELQGYEPRALDFEGNQQLSAHLASSTPGNWLCIDDASEVVAERTESGQVYTGDDRSYRIGIIRRILSKVDQAPTREHLRRMHDAPTEALIAMAQQLDPTFRPDESATALPMPVDTPILDEFDGEIDQTVVATLEGLSREYRPVRNAVRPDRDRRPRRSASVGGVIDASRIAKRVSRRDDEPAPSKRPEPVKSQVKVASYVEPSKIIDARPAPVTDEAAPSPVSGISAALGLATPPAEPPAPAKAPVPSKAPAREPTPEYRPGPTAGPVKLASAAEPRRLSKVSTGGFQADNPFDRPDIGMMLAQIDSLYENIVTELNEGFNMSPDGERLYDPETQSDHLAVGRCRYEEIYDRTVLDDLIDYERGMETISTVIVDGPDSLNPTELNSVYDIVERLTSPEGRQCVRRYSELRHIVVELNRQVSRAERQLGTMCVAGGDQAQECSQYRERLAEYRNERLHQLDRAVDPDSTPDRGERYITIEPLPERPAPEGLQQT